MHILCDNCKDYFTLNADSYELMSELFAYAFVHSTLTRRSHSAHLKHADVHFDYCTHDYFLCATNMQQLVEN